jgi:hypothetical protein
MIKEYMFSHLRSPLNTTLVHKKLLDDIVHLNSDKKYLIGSFQGVVNDSFGNFYLCGRDWGIQKLSVDKPLAKKINAQWKLELSTTTKRKIKGGLAHLEECKLFH